MLVEALTNRIVPPYWKIKLELSALNRKYGSISEKMQREKKSKDEMDDFYREWSEEEMVLEEKLRAAYSDRLIEVAQKLWVMPPGPHTIDDDWERSPRTNRFYLTEAGFTKLRNRIREERKARRETLAFWFGVVGPLVLGLVGTLTGLVAVMKK